MSAAPAAKRARARALDAVVSTLAVPGLGTPFGLFVLADGTCLVSTEENALQLLAPSGSGPSSQGAMRQRRALRTARAPQHASTTLSA